MDPSLSPDYPFQITLLFLWMCMGSLRMYWYGYASALSPEKVDLQKEGFFCVLRFGLGVPLLLIFLAYIIYPPWVAWSQIPLEPMVRWFGLPLGILSILGLGWVHKNLAQNFTGTVHVREKGKLVMSGPYAYVRHPMYICFWLFTASVFLLSGNWILGGGLALVFLVLMIQRTPIEEAQLLERYGQEYEDYRRRVGKWLPNGHSHR